MTLPTILDTQLMVLLAVGLTSADVIATHKNRESRTADAGLYLAALRRGLPATNFNHKREEFGLV